MKILVTGAAGFSGSHLVEALQVNKDNQIIGVCRYKKPVGDQALEWLKCDLMDQDSTNKIIEFSKPEIIYHLAAYSSPHDSFKHPQEAINQTSTMQVNLFEACIKADITPRVLVSGSGQIYSPKSPLPINEEGKVDCSSPYAVAKYTQESIASYYLKRGFEIVIARAFNHTGPRQKLGFLVSDLAYQVAKAENSTDFVIKSGDLTSKRDFTDVRDVAQAYVKLLEQGQSGEVYNVCSGKSVSGQTILDSLIEMAKRNIDAEVDPERMRPSDIMDLYGDNYKITKATGWRPSISLDQTLQDTLNYWRQQLK